METRNKNILIAELAQQIIEQVIEDCQKIRLLDKKEASKLMGISPSTFDRLELPRVKLEDSRNGAARYRIEDIQRAIEKRTIRPDSGNRKARA